MRNGTRQFKTPTLRVRWCLESTLITSFIFSRIRTQMILLGRSNFVEPLSSSTRNCWSKSAISAQCSCFRFFQRYCRYPCPAWSTWYLFKERKDWNLRGGRSQPRHRVLEFSIPWYTNLSGVVSNPTREVYSRRWLEFNEELGYSSVDQWFNQSSKHNLWPSHRTEGFGFDEPNFTKR